MVISVLAWSTDERLEQTIRLAFEQASDACAPSLAGELQAAGPLRELYARQGFAALWEQPTRRAVLDHELQQLADDGLQPADYPLKSAPTASTSSQQQVCDDLEASHSYLRALQHLMHGRLQQDSIEPFWRASGSASPQPRPGVLELALNGLDQPAVAFAAARPTLMQYQALRQAYAERRRRPLGEWPEIPAGRLMRPDSRDERIPLLVARLAAEGYLGARPAGDASLYDTTLLAAVMDFQARHGLQADGLVGPQTLSALNTSARERLEQLQVNLERWRWLANDIEAETLLVDIAGGLLSYYAAHQLRWQGRAVVGRPSRQTPQLKSLLSRLTLNPTWSVPPTILREDKLPEIRRDPDYLARHHMRVLDRHGVPLDPASIDWNNPGNIILRQDPGPDNPLGQLAIRFPNPFSVYLHDTPSQQLFSKSPRAFSSGCVRIEGILELLKALLPADDCSEIARRLDSGQTEEFPIQRRLPIVIAYWTATVAANGELVLRNDLYERDRKLLSALREAGH